jgi:hypothetical protein
MKKTDDQMLESYDIAGKKGVRGKYAKALKDGHVVRIYSGKKRVSEKFYAAIEPDVHAIFPDSRSINETLRKLISLVPERRSTQ